MRAHPRGIQWAPALGDESARGAAGTRAEAGHVPLRLRVEVLFTRWKLDRAILAGHELGESNALALRARQLTDEATRRSMARSLRGVVEYVDHRSHRPVITPVVIDPPAVRAGRRAILDLADTLEWRTEVQPRGVLLARKLLTDGTSPLFNRASRRNVTEAVWEIEDALDNEGPTVARILEE